MAIFKKFEEIECWKKASELTRMFTRLQTKRHFPETLA